MLTDEQLQTLAALAEQLTYPTGVKLESTVNDGGLSLELSHTSGASTRVFFPFNGSYTVATLQAVVDPGITTWLATIPPEAPPAELAQTD